jgi:hypothetical protein
MICSIQTYRDDPTHNAQDDFARGQRRSWARLSKKVFEAEPFDIFASAQ